MDEQQERQYRAADVLSKFVNVATYKTWYGKLCAEKIALDAYLRDLKNDGKDMLYDFDIAFPD